MPDLRTLFLGTPEIAVPALRLLAHRTQVLRVITQPDRPAGRGQREQPPAVKVAAHELGLPVWQPETLKGAESAGELQGADLFIVMAYGELLRQPVLDLPTGGCINLHASLLPRWRGASPLQAVIRAGDDATGISIMRMVRGLDAGPVYLRETVTLLADATLPWLHDRLAVAAADALGSFLDVWPTINAAPQDEALVTHCRKLTSDDGRLDWRATRVELDRWVRAYTPAPGCWTLAGSERLRILAVAPREAASAVPGTVRVHANELQVATSDGWLAITRLQAPGKKALDAAAWLNGASIPASLGG